MVALILSQLAFILAPIGESMTQTFPCPACGAPNKPATGQARMSCAYCGANLAIPENLQTKSKPKVEILSSKAGPVPNPEIDAADLLRKAQPVAIGAWNLYAMWTWIRWLLPTCLIILVVFFVLCVVLGALPIVWSLFQ
jgi:hypothetical protein